MVDMHFHSTGRVLENYIAHTDAPPPWVIERIVFGGDVLTHERAYSAQLAKLNGQSYFI